MAAELGRRGLPGDALTIEITEDQTLDVEGQGLDVLRRLAASGVRIAIDDFGSGYAGLAAFRDVPAQVVKIDRGFVTAMLGSHEGHDLVDSMIQLAHRFERRVVAEGVETEAQRAALVELGCDYVQGYLTGRPMPASEVPVTDASRPADRAVVLPGPRPPGQADAAQVLR
ncbi:hypothetical protein N866_13475 [Actinotalea ferrariae CF5-4]|uniref:EAL domain-containing protein n=1 Tax=Actinotalea ferrariae CF5-4 TaxID=948458 RepID=A0A021VL79_9CELL|nr:EAL domain-containing protein [Actinotalea ferrariae]EYR61974.1 hypothetical protein N866_13475 [Actinotalea ferrariae CF5-4]